MKVLIVGGRGFIGRHVAEVLRNHGHQVMITSRSASDGADAIQADYRIHRRAEEWLPKVTGFDCVINAAGILRETPEERFEWIHDQGPRALFDACAQAGVSRVIQISALGADEQAASPYHLSKKAADDHLRSLDLSWTIVQPSIVYGIDGVSAGMFNQFATMPLLPLPGDGQQRLQPIHIHDLAKAVAATVERRARGCETLSAVGSEAVTYVDLIARLRKLFGYRPALRLPVPMGLMRAIAVVTKYHPRSLLAPDSLEMLERGNTGDPSCMEKLLGVPPRPVERFLKPWEIDGARQRAALGWLRPLMVLVIALLWILSGLFSMLPSQFGVSEALLIEAGVARGEGCVLLFGGALLDIALGVATFWFASRRAWWAFLVVVTLAYSLITAVLLPAWLVHPFLPLLKNLPILLILLLLWLTSPS